MRRLGAAGSPPFLKEDWCTACPPVFSLYSMTQTPFDSSSGEVFLLQTSVCSAVRSLSFFPSVCKFIEDGGGRWGESEPRPQKRGCGAGVFSPWPQQVTWVQPCPGSSSPAASWECTFLDPALTGQDVGSSRQVMSTLSLDPSSECLTSGSCED